MQIPEVDLHGGDIDATLSMVSWSYQPDLDDVQSTTGQDSFSRKSSSAQAVTGSGLCKHGTAQCELACSSRTIRVVKGVQYPGSRP